MRLAFKLFDSEGVALVNLLRGGSDALEEMRDRARDLGIVLDVHLVRDAERARTELDTLSQVISANLTRAALEAAPVIADLSSWLADVAGKAGIAWERLFDAPEEKSLRTLRYELDLASSTIEKLEGRIQELRESPTLGFTTFLDTAQIRVLEGKLEELHRARDQIQARIAFVEGPPRELVAPPPALLADDDAGVQERAKQLERIARELEGTLFTLMHQGSARIIAEHERRVAELRALRARDGSNALEVDSLIAQSAAVRDAQLSQLRAKEVEAAEKIRAANDRVVGSLEAERVALTQTERERFVAQALSRLSAEATAEQRREVERLASALFDEQQALQARQRLMDEGRSVIERTRTATEQYAAEIEQLNTLLAAGAVDQATYTRAVEDANERLLRSGQAWSDGAQLFLQDYLAQSNTRRVSVAPRPPPTARSCARPCSETSSRPGSSSAPQRPKTPLFRSARHSVPMRSCGGRRPTTDGSMKPAGSQNEELDPQRPLWRRLASAKLATDRPSCHFQQRSVYLSGEVRISPTE